MTYSSNEELPFCLRLQLPSEVQDVYREAFNKAIGDGGSEFAASYAAWAEIQPLLKGKESKKEVNYREGEDDHHCGICTMFIKPDSCSAVKGSIDPGDVCDLFALKKSAEEQAAEREPIGKDGAELFKGFYDSHLRRTDWFNRTGDSPYQTLYVRRDVLNGQDIVDWAKANGFAVAVPQEEMHVTIAFSRQPVHWNQMGEPDDSVMRINGGRRQLRTFGDNGEAAVLVFDNSSLEYRHKQFLDRGASWDWEGYHPHITITYQNTRPEDVLKAIVPYRGPILLGPEIYEPVNEDWQEGITEKAGPADEPRDNRGRWSSGGSVWDLRTARDTPLTPQETTAAEAEIKQRFVDAVKAALPAGTQLSGADWERLDMGRDWMRPGVVHYDANGRPDGSAEAMLILYKQGISHLNQPAAGWLQLTQHDILVNESARGHGIGGGLVAALAAGFKALGAQKGDVAIHLQGNPGFWRKMQREHGIYTKDLSDAVAFPKLRKFLKDGAGAGGGAGTGAGAGNGGGNSSAGNIQGALHISGYLGRKKPKRRGAKKDKGIGRILDPAGGTGEYQDVEDDEPVLTERRFQGLNVLTPPNRRARQVLGKFFKAAAVDPGLGLVFGWAICCNEDGEPYFDTQGDHIPEDSMLKAAAEFMGDARAMKVMHAGPDQGRVVFAWPLTEEIAKAMGLQTKQTGLMIAVKPDDPAVLDKFRRGEYLGFSIGGMRLKDEDAE